MPEENKKRINAITAGAMIFVALALDLSGLLLDTLFFFAPIFGFIISFIAWILFAIWFLLLGIGLLSARRLAAFGSGIVIEAVPVLNMLPGITVSVVAIIIMVKLEDRLGVKLPGAGMKLK